MESLLAGQSIRDIARRRHVRVGCVYAQRSKAITKLRRLVSEGALHETPRASTLRGPGLAPLASDRRDRQHQAGLGPAASLSRRL